MIRTRKQMGMSCCEGASCLSASQHHVAAGAGDLLLTKNATKVACQSLCPFPHRQGLLCKSAGLFTPSPGVPRCHWQSVTILSCLLPVRNIAVMAPQGSTLSSLLCCIYLAHLETEHLLPLLPQAAWHSSCTSAASSVAPRVH